ncbi:low-specificity L-threonine aldolase [Natranaerobius trueperi]|uniref:Low-specificity L-threonine aldolase n=1 Tax=Natranaerobius trueperi TaxID=759412 RepID=A0A226C0K1_9FIRM|nr:low-specificity L-threonine aldolase [Natranaerobius trueperi]OWZ84701.1 low-specificity L-threonine aldolase [Natranaerobius trueperi]
MEVIDLRSDTVTKPTKRMRQSMADAEVGDDVYEDDPTVQALEEKSSELFSKEAALFFPTGTMANQAALMAHTKPGDEIILEQDMHIYMYEVGGLSILSGLQARQLPSENGQLQPMQVQQAIRPENIHFPETTLICLENTHNLHGGTVLSKDSIDRIAKIAKKNNIPLHLDGARIFNAATYLNTTVKELVHGCDSVMFCLSKGLSAPVGSVLVGTKSFIEKARKCRKLLGGGMRQVGVMAAAGLVALEDMVTRLQEDHDNARLLAQGLDEFSWINVELEKVQTNIVRFSFDNTYIFDGDFQLELQKHNIKVNFSGDGRVRMVTHKDITTSQINKTLDIIAKL